MRGEKSRNRFNNHLIFLFILSLLQEIADTLDSFQDISTCYDEFSSQCIYMQCVCVRMEREWVGTHKCSFFLCLILMHSQIMWHFFFFKEQRKTLALHPVRLKYHSQRNIKNWHFIKLLFFLTLLCLHALPLPDSFFPPYFVSLYVYLFQLMSLDIFSLSLCL